MMYISVLKHPYDTSDTGVYNKYWKLACLHSVISYYRLRLTDFTLDVSGSLAAVLHL